jgi:hypothetical protein
MTRWPRWDMVYIAHDASLTVGANGATRFSRRLSASTVQGMR